MSDFSGLKAFVVEDEGAVAFMLEDMLVGLGCVVAASAARLDQACALAATADLDIAIVDVDLSGQSALPVARLLQERGVPVVFSTGYGSRGVPPEFAACPVLGKPFGVGALRRALAQAVTVLRDGA